MDRVQQGDSDALAQLYKRHFDDVFSYARWMLRNHDDALDASNEIFITVMRRAGHYDPSTEVPVRGWLFALARNVIFDQGRARQRQRARSFDPAKLAELAESRGPAMEPSVAIVEHDLPSLSWITDADLAVFVSRLPDAQREALILRYQVGLDTDEIARVMDRTPRAINDLHFRARRFLAERVRNVGRDAKSFRREWSRRRLRRTSVLASRRYALTAAPGVTATLGRGAATRSFRF
jgi:RNA polymerase sigma-70 factor (ECF subfamily)